MRGAEPMAGADPLFEEAYEVRGVEVGERGGPCKKGRGVEIGDLCKEGALGEDESENAEC